MEEGEKQTTDENSANVPKEESGNTEKVEEEKDISENVESDKIEDKSDNVEDKVEIEKVEVKEVVGKEVSEKVDRDDEKVEKGKDNIIYVGVKPFMNYVTGVVMQFQNKGQDEVIVSARGKFISKAVDVVEVARRTFLREENIKVKGININSEQFENKEGKRIYVSTIELILNK